MIRFSAGLVVVAIGVLIDGALITSKLSLVYLAIAISAVALVTLAIGVALKRDEIFGDGPGLAPAGAGAGSGMPVGQPADTGHVRGSDGDLRADQSPVLAKVPGPATAAFAAVEATMSAAPAVAAPAVAASAVASPPSGQRRPAFSQASTRVDETVADWDARPSPPSGSSDDQARPSWFDKLNRPVADTAARTAIVPPTSQPSVAPEPAEPEPVASEPLETEAPATVAARTLPAEAAPADAETVGEAADDDDWPTRYSWLDDDDPDQAGPAAEVDDVAEPEPEPEPAAAAVATAELVTVIPGVPRYHDPDCILIRFMDSGDVATKSVPEAKAANCTPCAACQPVG